MKGRAFLKRLGCLTLSLVLIIQLFAGCADEPMTDADIYLTKGEFFSYFVYEFGLTSSKYTAEQIQDCEDGSVEADIVAEWGYLPAELATKDIHDSADKEIVVMTCAAATFDLKKGDQSVIKDADLLDNPQLIADAYASGFFDLNNGYFDGAKEMSFADCEDIMNRAKNYTANFHYEANTEVTSVADGVIQQDDTDYQEGDIVVTYNGEVTNDESLVSFSTEQPEITTLGTATEDAEVSTSAQQTLGFDKLKSFEAVIRKDVFEKKLKNPKIGDTVVLHTFEYTTMLSSRKPLPNKDGEIIGILRFSVLQGASYKCTFEYPEFEPAVEKKNVEQGNGSGIDTTSFVKEQTNVSGWKLDFQVSTGGVKIAATKDFTVYETGRKQDWQNAKKTVTAKVDFEMSEFNVDVKNLKSFANKKGTGFIKVTCDTDMSFSLSQSLRYTPDSNRNGKFPSNWKNSRWTDTNGSSGAKTIKVARFSPSLYGVVGIDVYIYLQISVDGKIEFKTSIDGGGMEITANNGNIKRTKLGRKSTEAHINVNALGRLGVDATVKIFGFINVIRYDVGANLDVYAMVDLYYEDKVSKSGVCADEEGLNEYAADDDKFSYCIGVTVELSVSGKMMESGVKWLLEHVASGNELDFELSIWEGGFHFEDGGFVDMCSRDSGEMDMDDLDEYSDDILLSEYKVSLDDGETKKVKLTSLPSKNKELTNTKNAITVKSKNKKVAKATYDKKSKSVVIEAVGEGSTEIVITAKSGWAFFKFKKAAQQELSVTVNAVSKTGVVIIPLEDEEIWEQLYAA